MAITIENKSKCAICGQGLEMGSYIATPNFISNTNDTLFMLSDAGIHKECLESSPLKKKLIKILKVYSKQFELDISIEERKKTIFFGLLTSNELEPLSKYNYFIMKEDEIKKWKEKELFLELAKDFIEKGKWEGYSKFNYLDYLVKRLLAASE